jgi:acylphosphatase
MHRRTCHFSGRVQGVGFRYTVQNLALKYNVRGYVRNLPDGRVELIMEGPDGDLSHLLEDIKQKMNGFIRQVTIDESPPTNEFRCFCVKHG